MKWQGILVSVLLVLNLSGCGPVCGRHYSVVLLDKAGLEIVKTGKIKDEYGGETVLQYKDIPTSYELRREKYTLRFEPVGPFPEIKISSADKNMSVRASNPSSSDSNLKCYQIFGFDPSNSSDILFVWQQLESCTTKTIEITIKDSSGILIGREVLPFEIIEDGFYCYMDGI